MSCEGLEKWREEVTSILNVWVRIWTALSSEKFDTWGNVVVVLLDVCRYMVSNVR
jgi:hypothetical protein